MLPAMKPLERRSWVVPVAAVVLVLAGWPASQAADPSGAQPARFVEQAGVLRDALRALGAEPRVDAGSGALARVSFAEGDPGAGNSFSIRSDGDQVHVVAADSAGAAQAAATLFRRARIVEGERVEWPAFELSDGPDSSYRSFMVDMGRNPHGPEVLHQVVDMLWFYRANLLHLHLTDDQLFSWPSRAFPKLRSENAGWTWDDFVALEAACRARGITIVPEIDVPGHSTILRREYPEVFGETPTELASLPSAQQGLELLIDEMLSVFESARYVHVGGDEAYGVPEELQRDLINRLDRFVRSRDRRTVVWEGPRLGEGDNKVAEDVLHLNWRTINVPAQEMLDAGYEIVNAAWYPMYVVDHYPRTMFTAVDVRACFEWEPRRFQHIDPGIPTFATPHVTDSADGILGFCMPWWEGRQENLMALCRPRFAAVATAAWDLRRPGGYERFRIEDQAAQERLLALSGLDAPALPRASAGARPGNLALGRWVIPSAGASQPHFGPQRLTNGITDRFDHFLGFPTMPEPLRIAIELDGVHEVDRIVVHEGGVGESYELYRVEVSADGAHFETVGEAVQGTRGSESFVEFRFEARPVRVVRIVTRGCKQQTFPSFSRLVEVEVFAASP